MAELPQYWLLLAIAVPAFHTYYYGAFLGSFIDFEESNVTYWSYSLFPATIAAAFYWFSPIEFPFGFDFLFLLLVPVGFGLYMLETYLWYHYTKKPIEVASNSIEGMIPVPFVSIPEEVIFRGGLAPLIGVLGGPGYVVVSGALFGFYHYVFSLRDVLLKTVSGSIYAALFLMTGSLWPSILMHAGYNLASVYIIADYRHVPYLRRIAPGT